MALPTAATLRKAPLAYPDAIDTRFVLRLYGWLTLSIGVLVYLWPTWTRNEYFPIDIKDMLWGGHALTRVAAAVLVAAGLAAKAIAIVDDPVVRRNALIRFAVAHLVFGGLWLIQWLAILTPAVPAVVGWFPLLAGAVLLYVGLTAATATPIRRVVTHGLISDADVTAALRSRYEDQIRLAAQQEERTRLARDLHDAVKQQLFVIQTAAATVETRFDVDPSGAKEAVGQVRAAAREAIAEMRAMIEQLQAAPIENVGLAEALKKQCEALGFRTGAEMRVTVSKLPPNEALPPGAQQTLFRAAQEALANIGRHARASHVNVWLEAVSLEPAAGRVELVIADDGVGFDPASTPRGMGIDNMVARAREVGGSFSLQSHLKQGTTIRLTVPYSLASPWPYGRRALAWAAFLAFIFLTWSRPGRGFDPVGVVVAAITAIMVARNAVAYVRLRQRRSAA